MKSCGSQKIAPRLRRRWGGSIKKVQVLKPIQHTRGEMTRRAILEAAEQVFANVGFDAARLEDVALAVGIRRPSIVYHFANKQELYDAVELDIFESMHRAASESMLHAAGHLDRFLALLDGWLDYLVQRPTAARIILRLVADATPRGENPTQFSFSALRDMEKVISEGVASGEFRAVSPIFLINSVASSSLFYVCNGKQLGPDFNYDPSDMALLGGFRTLLHDTARAAVSKTR